MRGDRLHRCAAARRSPCARRQTAGADRRTPPSRRHHPSGRRRVHARRRSRRPTPPGAALIVFTLRTPGGLVDSTRDINNAIIAREDAGRGVRRPVGQPRRVGRLPDHDRGRHRRDGARARTSAPRTRSSGNGEKIDETMAKKMASDVAGYARTLATQRKRNVALVEQAVTESRSFTEQEALGATPPLIDLVATDVPDLLRKLDGRTIARFDGAHRDAAHRRTPTIRAIEMTLAAADPERHRAPADRLPAADARHARPDDRAVEPRRDPAGRRRRHLPAAGVLRVPGPAGQLRRRPADPVRARRCSSSRSRSRATACSPSAASLSLFFGSMMLIDSPLPELQVGLRLDRAGRRSALVGDRPVPRPARGQGAAQPAGHRRRRHARRASARR